MLLCQKQIKLGVAVIRMYLSPLQEILGEAVCHLSRGISASVVRCILKVVLISIPLAVFLY